MSINEKFKNIVGIEQMRIPAFGYSLTEYTIVDLPRLGHQLEAGESACLVESDKAVHEIAASCSGVVSELHASVGQVLPVGSLLLSISKALDAPSLSVAVARTSAENTEVTNHPCKSWRITPMIKEYFDAAWEIWLENQKLASRDWEPQNFPDLREQFNKMFESGLQAPFSIHCAFKDEQLDGWAGIFPTKNNPLSRAKVGEVSLYVSDPNATHTAGMLLMNHVISSARQSGMAFLIGMSNPNNTSVQKLLKATKFELLGSAGKLQTQIWVYNF